MPSTYAHYRLGQEVRKKVPEEAKKVIEQNPEAFLIGLHGPDILFYYKPLQSNPVNQIGYGMHERPGKEFFTRAARIVKLHKKEPAYLAYTYGFICHFALDVTCHGYIDEKIAASGVSHAEIEVEFDRELMVRDGLNPIRHCLTGHINPSMKNAAVIQDFYKGVGARQVEAALKGMIFNNKLLLAPSKIKRQLVYMLLRISGNYKEMHGLMVNFTKNPACADSTLRLLQLYKEASKLAVSLITEYEGFLNEEMPLNAIYNYTFGTRLLESEDRK